MLGFPQAFRLLRTRDTRGVSLPAWQAILAINIAWTSHGIVLGQPAMIAPNSLALAATLPVLVVLARSHGLGLARVFLPGLLGAAAMITVDLTLGSAVYGLVALVPALIANAGQGVALVRSPVVVGVSPVFLVIQVVNQVLWLVWALLVPDSGTQITATVTGLVAVFNLDERTAVTGIGMPELRLPAGKRFRVWDFWNARYCGCVRDKFGVEVPPKSCRLLRLSALTAQPTVLATIGLMAVVGGLAWPVFGMMPAFASEVLHVGSVGLGVLLAAGALGSIVGTVVIARFGRHRRGRAFAVASVLLPLTVMAFAQATTMAQACLLLVGVGVLLLVVQSLAITLVQIATPNRIRGRVMSVYSMTHAGADTVSNAAIGSLAQRLGLPVALTVGGTVALAFAIAVAFFVPAVRRLD